MDFQRSAPLVSELEYMLEDLTRGYLAKILGTALEGNARCVLQGQQGNNACHHHDAQKERKSFHQQLQFSKVQAIIPAALD